MCVAGAIFLAWYGMFSIARRADQNASGTREGEDVVRPRQASQSKQMCVDLTLVVLLCPPLCDSVDFGAVSMSPINLNAVIVLFVVLRSLYVPSFAFLTIGLLDRKMFTILNANFCVCCVCVFYLIFNDRLICLYMGNIIE